ncbi:hypothetical protein Tco_1511209, partial [Tanacetum coccineum]
MTLTQKVEFFLAFVNFAMSFQHMSNESARLGASPGELFQPTM